MTADTIFAAIRIFRPTHIEAENERERIVIALDHASGTTALVAQENKVLNSVTQTQDSLF